MKRLWLLLPCAALLASCDAEPDETFGPYLQNLTPTSIVVCWVTRVDATTSVSWGPTTSYGTATAGPAGVRYHQVRLSGLAPDTEYHYRARSTAGGASVFDRTGSFRTAPSDSATPYTFVHFGEEHTTGYLATAAPTVLAQDPLFVISAGDQVDWGMEDHEWKLYFDEGAAFWKRVPLFSVVTNHTYVKRLPTTFYHDDGDFLPIPGEPGKHMFKKVMNQPGNEEFYSVRVGSALYIFLNSTVRVFVGTKWFILESPYWLLVRQYGWLADTLRRANDGVDDPAHIVVTFHYVPYGSVDTDSVMRQYFVPAFERYGVDLVLVGHEVVTEHVLKNGIHYAQVSTGSIGGNWNAVIPESLYRDNTMHTFGVGEVSATELRYKFVNAADGTVLHDFAIAAD